MKEWLAFSIALMLTLTLASVGATTAGVASQPAQIFTVIDRTMVCTTAFSGGVPDRIRTLGASVSPKSGSGTQQFDPSLHLYTGQGAGATLVSVSTSEAPRVFPYVFLNRRRCTRVNSKLRLLDEERAAAPVHFGEGCRLLDAPPRIVVRLHAVMERATRWSVYKREYLKAQGKALEAFVSIRTYPARKPIAFTSFDRDGAARFFHVPRCTGD